MVSEKRIQRLNACLSMLTSLLMIVLPVSMAIFWLNFPENAQSLDIAKRGVLQIENIRPIQTILAASFNLVATLILVYGLWHLRILFNCFQTSEYFSERVSKSMHRFTSILFVSALLKIVSTIVLSVVLTWNNAPDQKALVVQFGSNEFWVLFIAATFWAISWTFREGQRLEIENKEFV